MGTPLAARPRALLLVLHSVPGRVTAPASATASRRCWTPSIPGPADTMVETELVALSAWSIAEGIGDLWLLVPSTIDVNSPAFTKAAKACHFH